MNAENKQDELARNVVTKMMADDKFSQWLGIKVIGIQAGYAKLKMTIREEMMNGLGVIHGGIAFSLADTTFAFACNSRNNLSMALDTSITFTKSLKPGDEITAEAKELHNGRSTGLYLITVINQAGEHVALFRGTCFRTAKTLIDEGSTA
jgi:acyl-CoA thioesterase